MTAKPIFIIFLNPVKTSYEKVVRMQNKLEEKLSDYHVLIFPSYSKEDDDGEIKIQVFFEKDFDQIKYDELKKLANDSLKQYE